MSEGRASELTVQVQRFIAESVIDEEPAWLGSGRSVDERLRLRLRLQRKAAERGLLAPHLPPRWGGLGLGVWSGVAPRAHQRLDKRPTWLAN